MSGYEPGDLDMRLMVALGHTLLRPFYRGYIESLGLTGRERILDYGSGSGICALQLARVLEQGGGSLTCVDISRRWIEVARRTLRRFPRADFHCGYIGDLDLPDRSYDAILIHFVLHDIPPADRPDVARHLARKLKPGCRIFVREPEARGGIDPGEVRALFRPFGLQEVTLHHGETWYTGAIYEGVFS